MAVYADGPAGLPDAGRLARELEASEDEVAQRRAAAEDLVCFVSFLGLEDEAVLGVGLRVHAHTLRQRHHGLAPSLEFACDYLDVEAFNEGVWRAAAPAPTDPTAGELPAMVSSARGCLNGWLPLYVNAEHWARARPYAPSAFARLAAGRDGAPFRPGDALGVCCSLLTCAVGGFTVGQMDPTCASPRTARRGRVNRRAIQMYADVHRLLLQMAREYPEIRQAAREQLRAFIHDPAARTRDRAPSLGNLVQCLLVTEEFAWEDLAPSIIPEALRRHVIRQDLKGGYFSSRSCRAQSAAELISAWDRFAPQACMVLCFSALFCKYVGRPDGRSLDDIEAGYDRCWGRLQSEAVAKVADMCEHLCRQRSVADFLPLLLHSEWNCLGELFLWAERHGRQQALDGAAELILWAEEHGRRGRRDAAIPCDQWPDLSGSCPLLQRWKELGLRRKRLAGRQPVRRGAAPPLRQAVRRQQWRHGMRWQAEPWYDGAPWEPWPADAQQYGHGLHLAAPALEVWEGWQHQGEHPQQAWEVWYTEEEVHAPQTWGYGEHTYELYVAPWGYAR